MLGHGLADAVLDGAEVLANDQRLGPRTLEGDDVEQILGRIADVRAVRGAPVRGHPPQPEQPHDVVDPQPAGARDRGSDGLHERLVVGVAQPPGDQRRRAPVLALGVEGVRRSADADALGEDLLPGPRVGSAAGDADRQVLDDSHPVGGGGELQLQRPLQPGVERDDRAVPLDVGSHRRSLGTAELLGPGVPVAPVLLDDRRPGGPVLQGLPLLLPPPDEGLAAAVGEEDPHQDLALARPDRVAVDQWPVGQRPAGVLLEVDPVGAGHLVHPEVDGVAEAAGGRQVGARLLTGGRGDGVQRVDQQEPGALVGGHLPDRVQVAEVTNAPARPAARRVELHRPPPGPVALGQPAAAR